MLSDYICPGNRIELQGVTVNPETGEEEKKIYVSEVYDLITDERIDLMMPLEKGQLRLLPDCFLWKKRSVRVRWNHF